MFLYEANLALYMNSAILRRFKRKIKKYRFWLIFGYFIELIGEREWSRNNIEYLLYNIYYIQTELWKKFYIVNSIHYSKLYCQSFLNIMISLSMKPISRWSRCPVRNWHPSWTSLIFISPILPFCHYNLQTCVFCACWKLVQSKRTLCPSFLWLTNSIFRSHFRSIRELNFTPRTGREYSKIFPAIRGSASVYKWLPKFDQSTSILEWFSTRFGREIQFSYRMKMNPNNAEEGVVCVLWRRSYLSSRGPQRLLRNNHCFSTYNPSLSQPWNSACYVMITVDRGSTSTSVMFPCKHYLTFHRFLFDSTDQRRLHAWLRSVCSSSSSSCVRSWAGGAGGGPGLSRD